MMNETTERHLVTVIYAITGGLFGAGALWVNGVPPIVGMVFGGAAGVIWSQGKQFRHVWRAGLGFVPVGLTGAILRMTMDSTTKNPPDRNDWFILLSFILSGWVCGSLFGTPILSRKKITDSWLAAIAGISMGLLVFLVTLSFIVMFEHKSDPGGYVWLLFIFFGWVTAIPGGVAGYHLFRMGVKQDGLSTDYSFPEPDRTLELMINPMEEMAKYHDPSLDHSE